MSDDEKAQNAEDKESPENRDGKASPERKNPLLGELYHIPVSPYVRRSRRLDRTLDDDVWRDWVSAIEHRNADRALARVDQEEKKAEILRSETSEQREADARSQMGLAGLGALVLVVSFFGASGIALPAGIAFLVAALMLAPRQRGVAPPPRSGQEEREAPPVATYSLTDSCLLLERELARLRRNARYYLAAGTSLTVGVAVALTTAIVWFGMDLDWAKLIARAGIVAIIEVTALAFFKMHSNALKRADQLVDRLDARFREREWVALALEEADPDLLRHLGGLTVDSTEPDLPDS